MSSTKSEIPVARQAIIRQIAREMSDLTIRSILMQVPHKEGKSKVFNVLLDAWHNYAMSSIEIQALLDRYKQLCEEEVPPNLVAGLRQASVRLS